jgi:hypothetical protein
VRFNGHSIADLLDLPIADALPMLKDIPQVRQKLQTLVDVGLGYIHLGQSATTLSGGEAQRMKLARELSKRQTGRTLYLLDEPTTGLHFDDVRKLLEVLHRLTDLGNTVIIIEHNLDIVRNADWVSISAPRAAKMRRPHRRPVPQGYYKPRLSPAEDCLQQPAKACSPRPAQPEPGKNGKQTQQKRSTRTPMDLKFLPHLGIYRQLTPRVPPPAWHNPPPMSRLTMR